MEERLDILSDEMERLQSGFDDLTTTIVNAMSTKADKADHDNLAKKVQDGFWWINLLGWAIAGSLAMVLIGLVVFLLQGHLAIR